MAIETMNDAEPGKEASSGEYNKIVGNVRDLDARLATVETGAIRFRAVRTTAGNMKTNDTAPVAWPDGIEYAEGITLKQQTRIALATPGLYLFSASVCLSGAVSSGNRLQIRVAPSDDQDAAYGLGQHPLPGRYPLASVTALVLATDPLDVSVYTWTDTTAAVQFYTPYNYCQVTATYLGGVS